jgi:hypothetical protein
MEPDYQYSLMDLARIDNHRKTVKAAEEIMNK